MLTHLQFGMVIDYDIFIKFVWSALYVFRIVQVIFVIPRFVCNMC
jgi:predicted amidohydrolase